MRLLALIVFGALMTMMSACDGAATKTSVKKKFGDDAKDPSAVSSPIAVNFGGDYKSLDEIRRQALSLIKFRIKQHPDALSMITYGSWEPEFVNNSKDFSKEFAYLGQWIDFNDDFTYQYGYYDNIWGGGQYHYLFDNEELVMLDNDNTQEPKVWKAMNNGEMMVFVGQHMFEINNGWQMRLLPADKRPTKKK